MTARPFDLAGTPLGPGTTLLEASAGTGKTYTITGIVLRLLLERLVPGLPQVLVVTFTVAATEELKSRLRAALQQALAACEGRPVDDVLRALGGRHGPEGARILRAALGAADELSVATIHGFCHRVLEEAAFETGLPFDSGLATDELPLLATAARDALRLEVAAGPPLRAAVAEHGRLQPEALLRAFRAWQQVPDATLWPEPGPLDEALAALDGRIAAARSSWDAAALGPRIAALPFQKDANGSPVRAARRTFAAELSQRLLDGDDPCLQPLCALAPARLDGELLKRGRPSFDHPFFAACDAVLAAADAAVTALRARLLQTMAARLLRARSRDHVFGFQDLLTQVHAALRDPVRGKVLRAAVRSRWQAALIDEFQDTDPLQYEIFATCFGDQRLVLVGDPKQSIYGFRGADVHAYLRARQDALAHHTLAENHRSHPRLVNAVGRLFRGPAAFALEGIAMPGVVPALSEAECAIEGDDRPPLQFRWLPGPPTGRAHGREHAEQRITRDVASECVRLLAGGLRLPRGGARPARPLSAGDLAVLTRTNAQAVAMQDELRARGVPSAIGKAGDVFRCAEMEEVLRLLTALGNATYAPHLRAAWTTPLWGMTADDLRALDAAPDRLARELDAADELRRTWLRHGFVVMFERLLHRTAARQRLLRRADGERKLTNYLQIAELLHHAETGRRLAPESLAQWLQHERRHAQEIDYQLRELRLESDADAVQILTVHGSKGLQYEVVFVPFAWHARDHRSASGPVLVRDPDGAARLDCDMDEESRALVQRETLQEDLRLLYVALTRARRRCYVHWTHAKAAHLSALAYLLHGPGRDPAMQPAALPPHERLAKELQGSSARWHAGLCAFAAECEGGAEVAELPEPSAEGAPVLAVPGEPLLAQPRPLPQVLPDGYRIASFTSLLRHAPEGRAGESDGAAARAGGPADDEEAADRDIEADPQAEPEGDTGAGAPAPAGMFAFARGARAGVCLHEILEHTDFAAAKETAARERIRARLWRHGLLEPAAHRAPIDPVAAVHDLVAAVAGRPLGDLPFRLADRPRAALQAEWQFFLGTGRLRPRELATVFAAHGGTDLAAYGQRLAALPATALHGFLRGFVDLVAEHGGRYWVLDWKSNHLGDRPEDYAAPRLWTDLQEHDYVLQYHLYLLALHRHLRARLRDYDYDRHVGGACYVYLRGLGPDGQGGAISARPARACIDALDGWLCGEVPSCT